MSAHHHTALFALVCGGLWLGWATPIDAQESAFDNPASDTENTSTEPGRVDDETSDDEGNDLVEPDGPEPLFGVLEPARDVYDEGAFAYVFAGISSIDLDEINTLLTQYGYGRISKTFTQIGTGALITVKRFLFGLEYYRLNGHSGSADPNSASFDGEFTVGHLAYLLNAGPIHVYPLLGVGYGSFELGLVGGRPDLEDVLEGRSITEIVNIHSYVIQVAVSAEYLIRLTSSTDSVRGFLVGLRLGFFFTPLGSIWDLSGVEIGEPENSVLTSVNLNLILGFGSWSASELPMF